MASLTSPLAEVGKHGRAREKKLDGQEDSKGHKEGVEVSYKVGIHCQTRGASGGL